MFNDQRRSLLSMLVGLAAIALFSGFASGADTSSTGLAAYDVTLTPNFITPNDPSSSNYQAVWLYGTSPTTPYISPDSYAHQGRYLLLDPRYTDSSGRPGRDDWWFIVQRYWPSSYQPSNHGNWGREVNFHNVAGDAGPGGGIGWSFGSGVSSLALDWLPGQSAPQFTIEPNHPNENLLLPPVSRDTWHTYVVHFVAGRTDDTTPHAGCDHGLGRRLRHAGHQPQQHQHRAARARPRRQLVRAALDAALGGRLHPGPQRPRPPCA